jgi:tetratricopeptide (TPR) repeat protein
MRNCLLAVCLLATVFALNTIAQTGLYESNLRSAREYNCHNELILLERKIIVAKLNGNAVTLADHDAIIAKATECIPIISVHAYDSRAKAYIEKGNYNAALADFDKAITASRSTPDTVILLNEIYENRADLYMTLGDRAKAEADLREAIRLAPSHTSAKDKLEHLDAKMAEARKAAALANPQSADDYLIVGDHDLSIGKYELAVTAYDRSIALGPSTAAYLGKGTALRWLSRFDAALIELNKALALAANNIEVLTSRGYVNRELKKWDAAIADFTNALALADIKKKSNLLNARGAAYVGKGSFDAALKDQNDALAASDDVYSKINAYTGQGNALRGLGRSAEALAAYDAAIAAAGTDAFARLNLIDTYTARGKVFASQGKADQAKADFNEAIKISPNFSQEAKAELAKLTAPAATNSSEPKTAQEWAAAGRYAANEQKWDEALRDFTECITLAPNISACYAFRGAVAGVKGDLAAARKDFDKAIALSPNEPAIYFMRAQMYLQLGNKPEAIADLRAVLRIAPGNPQAVKALESLGEKP